MVVRTARQTDISFLKRLLVQLGYPALTQQEILEKIDHYSKEGYQLLVAETDHEVVGFISLHWFQSFHFDGCIGRISAFCVDERFRGQGIGATLLRQAEDLFKLSGCTKIEVTSNNRRTETHQFYLGHGYKEDSRRFVKYCK